MPIAQLLKEFDEGVKEARREYYSNAESSRQHGFTNVFANFSFYDKRANHRQEADTRELLVRLDNEPREPILWKHIRRPLAKIMRAQLGGVYTGFTTLFTINHDAIKSETGSVPLYASMVIDDSLREPGLKDAKLSREQFERSRDLAPIPLTAVCLNSTGLEDFDTRPIIFHWMGRDPQRHDLNLEEFKFLGPESWVHIYVSALVPYDMKNGLKLAPDSDDADSSENRMNWSSPGFSRISVYDPRKQFDESKLYARLRRYLGNENAEELMLRNKLAWTVTYFVYASECFRKSHTNSEKYHLDHLEIVCAPATFDDVVSSALYVPLYCKSYRGLGSAATKVLLLARSLAMPLEKLKELSRGTRMAERDFAHLTSNTIDSIVTSIGRLPQEVRKEMGALLLARLNLLQETIHSYISADARVYPGDFPYPWSEGDEILPVYCDIAIQLALQRAQDGSNDEPEVRRFGREWSQKEENRFGHSGFDKYRLYVEDIPQVHPPVSEYLKDSPFAVLFILAFKQAYYHTLRAWLIGGSDSKMGVSVRTNEGSFIFECVIKNPQVLLDDPDKTSKEAFEFEELAKHFSSIPEAPVHYSTIGPAFNVNDRCWCTTIKIGKRI